jgi:hypothetical protein
MSLRLRLPPLHRTRDLVFSPHPRGTSGTNADTSPPSKGPYARAIAPPYGYVICSSSINSAAGSPSGIPTVRAPIYIPQLTEESIGPPILIRRFKGTTRRQTQFDLLPQKEAFFLEGDRHRLAFTMDGGRHWYKQALPRHVNDCQVFEGDLLCSSAPGFQLLTLHPK